nr:hypothetical protein [Lachnospiraceae bacterium]
KQAEFSNLEPEIESINVYQFIDYSAVYDFNYYITNNPELYDTYKNDPKGAIKHFAEYGINEGKQAKGTFDVASYRNRWSDLRRLYGWNNLREYYNHYIQYGQKEGRTATGISEVYDPIHVFMGTDFSSVYDYKYYKMNNPDVAAAIGDDDMAVFCHFLNNGMKELRVASPTFNVQNYIMNNPDLVQTFGLSFPDYYLHYIQYGRYEGRKC